MVRLIVGFFVYIALSAYTFADTLKIAAAANLSYGIKTLSTEFLKTHPDIKIDTIIASSGKLTAQIMHEAPYDIFLSADMKYPQRLYTTKFASSKPTLYAQGRLILLSTKDRDLDQNLTILQSKSIKTIATANPGTAPYGIAAKEAMQHAAIYDAIKDKFIYGQSISQTLTYTLNAADIGLVAKSSILNPKLKNLKHGKNWIDVNPSLYKAIDQGMVLLKNGSSPKSAKLFYDFILSQKGKEILRQSGYTTP